MWLPGGLGSWADSTRVAADSQEPPKDDRWALGAAVLYGDALEGRLAVMGEEGRARGELAAAAGRGAEAAAIGQWGDAAARLTEAEGRERNILDGMELDISAERYFFWTTDWPPLMAFCCWYAHQSLTNHHLCIDEVYSWFTTQP